MFCGTVIIFPLLFKVLNCSFFFSLSLSLSNSPGHSRSLLGKDEQPTAKVSLFTDSTTQEDTDPYGVSSKPGMPWDTQAPAQYSSKKDLPSLHNSVLDAEGEGELLAKNAVGVETMEVNDTEDNKVFKGDHFPDTFQDELLFESEAGRVDSADHQPPPAKIARQESVGDDDL